VTASSLAIRDHHEARPEPYATCDARRSFCPERATHGDPECARRSTRDGKQFKSQPNVWLTNKAPNLDANHRNAPTRLVNKAEQICVR